MKKRIRFAAGCPTGTTVSFTRDIIIDMDDEMAYEFCESMMEYIETQAILWGSE